MAQKDNLTKDEHYIPKLYLRFFSPNENQIYQYRIGSRNLSKFVPIDSICYKKHLYELKNDNNEFICRNMIEKALSDYEGVYDTIVKSIISKSANESNYNIPCFLSTDEKRILISFVATTILRSPRSLELAKECALDLAIKDGKNMLENAAKNSAILTCVPFDNIFNHIYKSRNDTVLDELSDSLMNMSFLIGVANGDKLYTSDNPVYWHGSSQTFDIDEVVFPLTSNLVLFLYPKKELPIGYRNKAIRLTDENVKGVNNRTIHCCREWVYSKKEINEAKINIIEEIKGEPKCRTLT